VNPTGCSSLGFLKNYVFKNNLHMTEELNAKITPAMESIMKETMVGVMEN
jgi:hypothetical protein